MKNLLKNSLIKNYFILVVFLSLLEVTFRLISGLSLKNIALLRIFIGINFVSILLTPFFVLIYAIPYIIYVTQVSQIEILNKYARLIYFPNNVFHK